MQPECARRHTVPIYFVAAVARPVIFRQCIAISARTSQSVPPALLRLELALTRTQPEGLSRLLPRRWPTCSLSARRVSRPLDAHRRCLPRIVAACRAHRAIRDLGRARMKSPIDSRRVAASTSSSLIECSIAMILVLSNIGVSPNATG
eukprot:2419441-Pleurochrysis_carterae.AAC.9